ncbi:hypothetical protein CYMTET_50577 [Cymbomonas tetramitiformis]|uniref:Uncharacterized protein n=1 Tax=Cymbomonas tetramitiformis TaxID=36881 RepID=A0AAE0BMR8_9CHLO|nr:hypothetical protein CYMTET_50577 [Cymbomonas tetramitiformis]
MARTFLAVLFLFVETAVHVLADQEQAYVEQNFRMIDAVNDPHYSSVTAAKNGFRVLTNPPERGITETLTVTYSDGLYVAGEKVVTESEHRKVVGELETRYQGVVSELRADLDETKLEVLALGQALREVSPANTSLILQPPTCEEPGGDKLHFNGTQWVCVCKDGFTVYATYAGYQTWVTEYIGTHNETDIGGAYSTPFRNKGSSLPTARFTGCFRGRVFANGFLYTIRREPKKHIHIWWF